MVLVVAVVVLVLLVETVLFLHQVLAVLVELVQHPQSVAHLQLMLAVAVVALM
jgi:hypothetical protein